MRRAIVNRLSLGICLLAGIFLLGVTLEAQNAKMEQSLNITVQVLDGRNGKPLKDQHLLVFTGKSSEAVKSHAEHTALITDKAGIGILTVYLSETPWLQVFADGRVLCYPNPNQSSFSINEIMSKGVVTPNTCSSLVKDTTPGRLIVFARPTTFMEKMKQ